MISKNRYFIAFYTWFNPIVEERDFSSIPVMTQFGYPERMELELSIEDFDKIGYNAKEEGVIITNLIELPQEDWESWSESSAPILTYIPVKYRVGN